MSKKKYLDYLGHIPWGKKTLEYLSKEYPPLEDRLIHTFRYVNPHKSNLKVFSSEYSSILRDTGSIFTSLMYKIHKGYCPKITGKLYFHNYRNFLTERVWYLSTKGVGFKPIDRKYVFPFLAFEKKKNRIPKWWDAYTKIRHLDIINYRSGNLRNVISAMSAVFIIYSIIHHNVTSELFEYIEWMREDDVSALKPAYVLFTDA